MHDHWIQGAIKSPGALKETAAKTGKINKQGNIDAKWLDKEATKNTTTGQRARLAKTLKGLHHG